MSEQKRKTIRDWDPDQPVVREESIDFVLAKTAGSLLKLQIADMDLDGYDEMCLVPVQTGCLRPYFCNTFEESGMLCVDLGDLEQMTGERPVKFRLALAARKGTDVTFYNLKCRDEKYMPVKQIVSDKRQNFFDLLWRRQTENKEMICLAYYNEKRQLMISVRDKREQYMPQVTNELLRVKFCGPKLVMEAECYDIGLPYTGFVLVYRSQLDRDKTEYFVPGESRKLPNGKIRLKGETDIRNVPLQMLYWDIHTAAEWDGFRYPIPMKTDRYQMYRYYETVLDHYSYKFDDGNIVFAYFTKGNSVALRYRQQIEQDTIKFRLKEKIALVLHKALKPYWDRKNIYLVYEKNSYMAQDNGYYFFQYCMEHHVEKDADRKILYLIDPKSPDYPKLAPYQDHVLKFGSIRHMIYLKSARLLISSETKDHAYIWRSMGSRIRHIIPMKKLVFLQHGVTAFKKNDFLIDAGKTEGWEMFVVTSEQEKNIIAGYYPEEKIAVTGFSRWDVLEDKSEGKNQILLMPTWRNWLDDVDDKTFRQSEYFKNYQSFLADPRLKKMMEQYDINLVFYIHPKFRDHIRLFHDLNDDRIRLVAFGEEPLNELMMRSKMLITDYSSVSWDMFYQKKPVLFYQFDIDDYNETAGSYIDLKTQLFGERAETPDQLYQILEEALAHHMKLDPKYEAMYETAFAYHDRNNSKRIWDTIIHQVDPKK